MANSAEQAALVQLEQAVLKDISEYGQCSIDNFPQSQKLETSIQGGMSRIRALMRDLELLVEELDSEDERLHVARLLSTHTAEYNKVQQAFKAATLQRRQTKTMSAKQERQELLGTAEGGVKRRQMQTDSDVVAVSQGITESLRRTRQMMVEELAHTSSTLAAMEVSHTQLGKTRDEYTGQHSLLKKSKGLLKTIDWQNKSETYMLWGGLILFALVSFYVAQKRAMYFVPESLRPMALIRTAAWVVKGGGKGDVAVGRGGGEVLHQPVVQGGKGDIPGDIGRLKPLESDNYLEKIDKAESGTGKDLESGLDGDGSVSEQAGGDSTWAAPLEEMDLEGQQGSMVDEYTVDHEIGQKIEL